MALTFDVGANERAAVAAMKNLTKSVKDADEALDDLSKGSGLDKVENDLEGVGRAASKAGDKVKRDLKGGLKEAGAEANQSGREAAASFGGGFEDVGDFVQETLANAFGGLGPIGAGIGLAAAAVVGTVLASSQQAQESLEESRQRAVDLANQLYENNGVLPITDRVGELFDLLAKERNTRNPFEKLANDFLDFGTNIDLVKDSAKAADIPVDRFFRSLTGTDLGATKETLEAVNDALRDLEKESGSASTIESFTARQGALQGIRTELESVVRESELASDLYNSTEFLSTKRIDDLAAAWDNASTKLSEYFEEGENGAISFDAAGYVAAFENELLAAEQVKANLVGLPPGIRDEALRQYGEGGALAADAYIDAYNAAEPALRAQLVAAAAAQGKDAGQRQGTDMAAAADAAARAAAQGWGPLPVTAVVNVDDSAIGRIPRVIEIEGRVIVPGGGISSGRQLIQ